MSQIIPCQREHFSIPDHVTYMNCAYMAPLSKSIEAAGIEGVRRKSSPWKTTPPDFFAQSSRVRNLFAQMVGGQGTDVCILPSVSYGIGIAAANLPIPNGANVVVLDEQFPSNYYPWLESARQSGGEMRTVARPEDGNWTPGVLAAIDDHTAIVALPHCHWTDGSLVDLEAVGAHCAEREIPLVLDVTQSLGALPLDVAKVKPAFMVAAAYKWLMGPYNIALMYVAPEYQNGKPLEYNWITRAGSEAFAGLVNYTDHLSEGAVKYDMGERSNFALLPMVETALTMLLDWGIENISATLGAYNQSIAEGAATLGFKLPPRAYTAPHLMGLRFPGKLPASLAGELAAKNIYVSVRGDAVRVSPHLYNNEKDRERFLEALKASS